MLDDQRANFADWYSCLWIKHPICSMYGIFTYICPKNHPNVGKYTIHGASGHDKTMLRIKVLNHPKKQPSPRS